VRRHQAVAQGCAAVVEEPVGIPAPGREPCQFVHRRARIVGDVPVEFEGPLGEGEGPLAQRLGIVHAFFGAIHLLVETPEALAEFRQTTSNNVRFPDALTRSASPKNSE